MNIKLFYSKCKSIKKNNHDLFISNHFYHPLTVLHMPKNRLEGFESTRMQFKICPQNVIANKMRMENRRNLFE